MADGDGRKRMTAQDCRSPRPSPYLCCKGRRRRNIRMPYTISPHPKDIFTFAASSSIPVGTLVHCFDSGHRRLDDATWFGESWAGVDAVLAGLSLDEAEERSTCDEIFCRYTLAFRSCIGGGNCGRGVRTSMSLVCAQLHEKERTATRIGGLCRARAFLSDSFSTPT